MKKFLFALAAAAAMFSAGFAGAAPAAEEKEAILIASGDIKTGSTYAIMVDQVLKYCGDGGNNKAAYSGGGTQNRDWLVANKVNMAALQGDTLEFTRRADPAKVANIRTIVALHPEEIHVIAYAGTRKEGGVLGFGATTIKYESLANLAGRTVGAVGGSFDSASVLAGASGVKFAVRRMSSNEEMKNALVSGQLDAVVAVGGAPLGFVAGLPSSFKILPIPQDIIAKLVASKLYAPAKVSYENLGAVGVDTVSTQSLIVSRTYASADMNARLKEFRSCFYNNLNRLKDARGTHPKWQDVQASVRGPWPWYDLP